LEKATLNDIVLWRGLAESAANLLKKGDLIYLEGKIRTRSFTDQAGVKRYTTEIIVEHFQRLAHSAAGSNEEQAL